jgi:Transposase IS66 family/Bacterial regulatory helix-turn-helix protein, lysR family
VYRQASLFVAAGEEGSVLAASERLNISLTSVSTAISQLDSQRSRVARLREMMLASMRIFADETVLPVRDPERRRTKHGYFWAIGRDNRPWRGDEPPAVPDRGHTHAVTLFGGDRGILQCDGYKAYKELVDTKAAELSMIVA